MNREEARKYFESLPLSQRAEELRSLLKEIETELVHLEAQRQRHIAGNDSGEDWDAMEIDWQSVKSGAAHPIHHLRLVDATDHLRDLMRKYGYLKATRGFKELASEMRAEEQKQTLKPKPAPWSDWVAKDGDLLDRPLNREWKDWLLPETENDTQAE